MSWRCVVVCAPASIYACRYHDEEHGNLLNSMWMIAITILCVGYGDIVPSTYGGRGITLTCGMMVSHICFDKDKKWNQKMLSTGEKHGFIQHHRYDYSQDHDCHESYDTRSLCFAVSNRRVTLIESNGNLNSSCNLIRTKSVSVSFFRVSRGPD